MRSQFGRAQPLAAVSYVQCMTEIHETSREMDIDPSAIYVAAAGATGSGTALGNKMLGTAEHVRLLCPIHWPWDTASDLAEIANRAAELLNVPHRLTKDDIDVRTDFIGEGYGLLTTEAREAIELLARTEGILLDPVYSAKAMAGLIHDVRDGQWKREDVIIFLHTGGTPAVFAYRDELMEGRVI